MPDVIKQDTGAEATAGVADAGDDPNTKIGASGSGEVVEGGVADKSVPTGGEGKVKLKLPASIKPPVKTGRFQQRISDLVGQRDSANHEASQLREELSRMRAIPKDGVDGASKVAGASAPGDVLNPEDFPTYGEYITALVNRTMEQKATSEKSQQANDAYERHKQERMATFNEQATPLATEYGDGFWDAITDPNLPITEAMADAVLELDELGPYTMLYLAAHKDEATKIARMNPRAATIAIGRLAAKLDYEIKQGGDVAAGATEGDGTIIATPSAVVGAPKPTPVPAPRGSAPALDTAPSDKDDIDTWLKKETNRLRRVNPNAKFYGAR